MWTRIFTAALAASVLIVDSASASKNSIHDAARRKQQRAAAIIDEVQSGNHLYARQMNETSGGNTTAPKRFYNNATASKYTPTRSIKGTTDLQGSEYAVTSLPDVNFDVGELYAGLVPIDNSNTSRALFSIFQPTIGAPVDEVTIWLNGGPGCSSLEGFFQVL